MKEIRISPTAHLRAMFNVAWSAFRHPFKTTIIDSKTGKVIGHYTREEYLEFLKSQQQEK